MVSNTKLFVLGFLCATAIVLGSGIVTLTLVLHKRKEIIQARRAAKLNKAGADTTSTGSVPDGTATTSLDDSASASTESPLLVDDDETDNNNANNIVIPSSKTIKPHPIVTPPPSHSHFGTHGRTPNPLTTHDVYHASPSTSGNYTASFSNLRQTMAPHSTDARTAGDAHLAMALRDIPFEAAGGINAGYGGTAHPGGGGVGGVGGILYGSYDGQERRGQDFVKLDHEERWTKRRGRGRGRGRGRARRSTGRAQKAQVVFLPQILWNNFVRGLERLGMDVTRLEDLTVPSYLASMLGFADEKDEKEEEAKGDGAEQSPDDSSTTTSLSRAERALDHLVKASELGNPLAQTMVAQSLANGILPVALPPPPSISPGGGPKRGVAGNLTVPTDFAHGASQLARALVLWHSAAMGGSVEAALALGYRAKFSAGMGNDHEKDKFVLDRSLRIAATAEKIAEYKRSGMSEDEATKRAHWEEANTNPRAETRVKVIMVDGSQVLTEEKVPTEETRQPTKGAQKDHAAAATLHPPSATSHYGLLGTCDSALAYYEAAAHLSMDEMEASELRGKVNPATDSHKLPIIHAHGGASSALSHSNKPDELEEAIQYYRLRAYAKPDADINAAYTLAQLHHHGLRGVKQSMSLALEYYTIAAEAGSWEAAGQAGKFHLWGMGVNETQRDLNLAYRYFKMGTPGGVETCMKRWNGRKGSKAAQARARRKKKQKKKKKEREAAAATAAKKDQQAAAEDGGNDDASGATEIGDGGDTASTGTAEDDSWVDEEEEEFWDDFDMCDHPSVNGMGLLYLFGVPMVLPPSREVATKYFNLAKDMGNMDASYNLAMMRLGWMDEIGARTSQNQYKDVGTINNAKKGVFMPSRHARDKHGLTTEDLKFALNEFNRASSRGHLQAKHRLGMLYAKGAKVVDRDILEVVGIENEDKATAVVVPRNCPMALAYYKVVAENGLSMTRRIRAAYKQYVAGDYVSSLRNYLAAAESGNVVAQINAAFLLERGTCLGLSADDCTSAAVRMWRAAARQGDVEACLRVGDFHYYGRLLGAGTDSGGSKQRKSKDDGSVEPNSDSDTFHSRLPGSEYKIGYAIGPYPWIRYVLYPEDLFFVLRKKAVAGVRLLLGKKSKRGGSPSSQKTCPSGLQGADGTCSAPEDPSVPWLSKLSKEDGQGQDQDHMALAARYYRMAAEEHDSARANFNLGFMHEWGLGLKQDFPLAKRHYDLCAASRHGEAELAVQVALLAMDWHQQVVRWRLAWDEWRESGTIASDSGPFGKTQAFIFRSWDKLRGRQLASADTGSNGSKFSRRGRNDARKSSPAATTSIPRSFDNIVLSHLFSWETLAVLLLATAITILLTDRVERHQQAQRRGGP